MIQEAPKNNHTPKPGATLAAMVIAAQTLEAQIVAHAEEHFGEVDPLLDQFLEQVQTQITEKADAYKYVMDRLEIESDQWARNAEKFMNVAKSLDRAMDRIKERIKEVMQMMGTDEVKGQNWRFKLSNSAPRIEVDVERLPDQYRVVKTVVEANQNLLRTAVKNGDQIPGLVVHESKSLRAYIQKSS